MTQQQSTVKYSSTVQQEFAIHMELLWIQHLGRANLYAWQHMKLNTNNLFIVGSIGLTLELTQ